MAKATDETKAKAKELGIKSWHVKGEETLLKEIAELDITAEDSAENVEENHTYTVDSAVTTIIPEPEPEVVTEKAFDAMALADLMQGNTWKEAAWSIKVLGNKSPFLPYKEIIEKKVNG